MAVKKINAGEQATLFVASGTGHAAGVVPDPGASAGTTKFLREDATWALPAGAGVTSLNTLTGTLTLVAGTNITITPSGSNLTIDASGTFSGTAAHFGAAGSLVSGTAGAAAGTGNVSSVTGKDAAGSISVMTGTPTTTGTLFTVTFAVAYSSAPLVVISPTDAAAALASGIYITATTGGFALNCATALSTSTAHGWNYFVIAP